MKNTLLIKGGKKITKLKLNSEAQNYLVLKNKKFFNSHKFLSPQNLYSSSIPQKIFPSIKNKTPSQVLNGTRNASKEKSVEIQRVFYISRESLLTTKPNAKHNYYYDIGLTNNGKLIQECLSYRTNWKEIPNKNNNPKTGNEANFIWRESSCAINFSEISKLKSNKQVVNHFEFHQQISNKVNLFINLFRYCEMKELNIFKYVPFTILFDYKSPKFINKFSNFEYMFLNMKKFVDDLATFNNYKKNTFYSDFFPFDDKLGSKTKIFIPDTHFKNENIWITKAPNLNRGRCIHVAKSIQDIRKIIQCFNNGVKRGYSSLSKSNGFDNLWQAESSGGENKLRFYQSELLVVQKYIEKPLLYNGRKFDIRIWVLLSQENKVYMFKEGHLKTCSEKYNIGSNDNYVHLTNYSFQKSNGNFSKFEKGNEVSFGDFQRAIDIDQNENKNRSINFKMDVMPKIERIIEIVFQSVKYKINGLHRNNCFEIFGFDFLLDENYVPYLIEVNTNPGLEISSPLIKMLVPRMINDALKLTLDKIFDNEITEHSFPVEGYEDNENMYKFLCDLNIEDEDFSYAFSINWRMKKSQIYTRTLNKKNWKI